MVRLRFLTAGALLAVVAGCSGGPKFVPVSGVVTVDGKPYAKGVVSFQPVGTAENPDPGRGSSAYTDDNGRFVLKCDDKDGALVGKHLVRIMTRGADVIGRLPDGTSPDGAPPGRVDPIPSEWNSNSMVEFEVPAGGTDKADFDIVGKGGKK